MQEKPPNQERRQIRTPKPAPQKVCNNSFKTDYVVWAMVHSISYSLLLKVHHRNSMFVAAAAVEMFGGIILKNLDSENIDKACLLL